MTYPPTPGGWQDPAGAYGAGQPAYPAPASGQPAYVDPASGQPAYIDPNGQPAYVDPISGQPAAVSPSPYAAYPGYQTYAAPAYPAYGGYTAPTAGGGKTNGMAIAAMVVSLSGAALLVCYGGGGILGLVGAILGHVAKRQIATRGEGGGGLALTGIIVGWITLALGVLIVIGVIWFVVWAVKNTPEYDYTPTPYPT